MFCIISAAPQLYKKFHVIVKLDFPQDVLVIDILAVLW
jgi:hypothetical protein